MLLKLSAAPVCARLVDGSFLQNRSASSLSSQFQRFGLVGRKLTKVK